MPVILAGARVTVEPGAEATMSTERNRVWWRSRRGLLELDLLLLPFVEACYETLSAADQDSYRALIEHDDPDIWAWLQAGAAPLAELDGIVKRIAAFGAERAER
jgi:antitoxin CptB